MLVELLKSQKGYASYLQEVPDYLEEVIHYHANVIPSEDTVDTLLDWAIKL